jgi:hypothetical protein
MPKEEKKKEVHESDDIEEQSSEVCQDCNKPLSKCECRDTKDNDDEFSDVDDDDDFGIEE